MSWLLPDGVEDVLPPQAWQLERIRRRLLDLYRQWGYEYVIPPMLEFLESLLTGTGHDLDLKTFKVTDQVSGRTMGIRADITPQAVRIDAHSLNRAGMSRLCYSGTVLHTSPDNMLASRIPIYAGAELFGDAPGTDLEIVSLMIESLHSLGIHSPHIELGDVGIFRQLVSAANLSADQQETLFDLVQRKSFARLADCTAEYDIDPALSGLINILPGLCGNSDVLARGRELLTGYGDIHDRLDNLEQVTNSLRNRFKNLDLHFDLSELRGYSYHTGIVFAAYLHGVEQAVAKGGRYDHVGEVFGRARRATGFDIQLQHLLNHAQLDEPDNVVVYAPVVSDDREQQRWEKVRQLRDEGYIVAEGVMPGTVGATSCDYTLEFKDDQWTLSSETGNDRSLNDNS